jgi:hypothetical protein
MTDETALSTQQQLGELSTSSVGDDDFNDVVKTSSYLPRIQLMTANSKAVKSGKVQANTYGMIREAGGDPEVLGSSLDCLVLAWRPKAMDLSGEQPVTSFDKDSALYGEIVEKSDIKDSNCMFGPEFLLWIPKIEGFVTFFMGSKSARRSARGVQQRMHKLATLTSKEVSTAKHTWYVPLAEDCPTEYDIPEIDDLKKAVDGFVNPPKDSAELAEDDGSDRER